MLDEFIWDLIRKMSKRNQRVFVCNLANQMIAKEADPDPRAAKAAEVALAYIDGIATHEELMEARSGVWDAWIAWRDLPGRRSLYSPDRAREGAADSTGMAYFCAWKACQAVLESKNPEFFATGAVALARDSKVSVLEVIKHAR